MLPPMEYHAIMFEVPPGPDGLNQFNESLQKWAVAGWSLHSQSMTVASTGINHTVLVMVVYERDGAGTKVSPTAASH